MTKIKFQWKPPLNTSPLITLNPLDPETKIQGLIEDLDLKNWIKVCESVNDVRRFALFNSSLLFLILEKIMLVVTKTMKNPRSALCKTSIMAAADIFNAFSDKLLDPLVQW